MKYAKSDDRETRREAYEVLGKVLKEHSAELDDIYDRMVHVRDRMAKKMGYKNYVELGYHRMGRIDYDQDKVKTFRENVLNDIVPVVSRLRTENAKRLGIDDYKLYDNDVIIPGGDPVPAGGKAEIFAAAREMYHAMGEETGKFIDMMIDNDAFDVDSRKNKWGGGYCTEFPKYKQPFILANFNGTAGDVDVMTHEAGHALNAYLIADNRFALEIPDMTPAERKAAWLELEHQYRPHISMDGMTYLEEGTRWQYQMHIYESPFYYIDYCLAQTAAFDFLLASQEDYDDAFARYIRLSKQGGEKLWTDLLPEAGFRSPFTPGALKELAEKVEALLEKIKV